VLLGSVLLACLMSGVWFAAGPNAPVLTKILATYPVTEHGMLYVVLSDAGAATVPATYRYYMYERLDDASDALGALHKNGIAFLVTRDAEAKIDVQGTVVKISLSKAVLSFNTPTLFRHGEGYTTVDVWLRAEPVD
jgi:hypothetical protein